MWKTFWLDANGRPKLRRLLHSPLFWCVAALKILSGMFLASGYFGALFFPFLNILPTTHYRTLMRFWQNGDARAFPYPAVMLYIMVALRLLLTPFGASDWSLPAKFLLYHIPLFVADLTILAVFVRWLHGRSRRVILLLWASPVLFYISYIHGQLDAVPIALLVLFLYFCSRNARSGPRSCLG